MGADPALSTPLSVRVERAAHHRGPAVITVGDVNRPPVFGDVGSQNVLENEFFEFSVNAGDPDGDSLVYSTGVLPAGAAFDDLLQTLSWMPDFAQQGNYSITFFATDDGVPNLTGQNDVPITVGDVPAAEELAEKLVEDVLDLELPKNVENSYVANPKKIKILIQKGKFIPAGNQLLAFIGKVTQDIDQGSISEGDGNSLLDAAYQLLDLIEGG
jgi:hypothetical protein